MRYSATDGLEALELHDFARDMQTQITDKLMEAIIEEEWLIRSIGIGTLKANRLYPTLENPINVTTLYEAFLQYDDKPMITGADAVTSTIQNIATTVNSMWLSEKKEIIHVSIIVKTSLALMSLNVNIG